MASKVALAVVMVFFVVFGNAFQGVREADRNLIANARILGASARQVTLAVVIPSALSWIIASLHVSFGFALVGAVVGEFLGSRQGIGLLIATAPQLKSMAGPSGRLVLSGLMDAEESDVLRAFSGLAAEWRAWRARASACA
jgi:NitT/TauT family transport system permease protein